MPRAFCWIHRLAIAAALWTVPLSAQMAAAQQTAFPEPRTIRVSGIGEARAQPDLARLTFAVETFAGTAREAGRENARIMQQVIEALTNANVPREDIETRNYRIHPEYVHDRPAEEPRVRGYRALNQVVLRTQRLDELGTLIDTALNAGANRMDGVDFELLDPSAVHDQALQDAVRRARASAQSIATSLGVRLGEVLDASAGVQPVRPLIRGRDMAIAEAPAAPTPIQPEEQTVRAQVTLVFAIEGS